MRRRLIPLLVLSALLTGCAVPQLPPLPTIAPTPSAAPASDALREAAAEPAAETAEAVPEPTPEPTPEPAPEASPEPTPRPLRAPEINEYYIDRSFFEPAGEQGSLIMAEYETMDYAAGEPITKQMAVYLPYGYDESRQYNVLFLLHTSGGSENTWLVDEHAYRFEDEQEYVSAVNMIDNLIQRGYCEPLIVVGPSGYLNEAAAYAHNSARDFEQFDQEFSQDILPFVAEHYATYAEGGSHEQLVAARDHFGVLGASFGAYMNYISILATHMDLAASYTFIGGGAIDYGYCYERWANRGYLDYAIDCLYFVEGEFDDRYGPESSYLNLLGYATDFFSEENLHYTTVYGAFHEPRSWVNGLYNTLQVFFRDEPVEIPYTRQ